MLETILTKIEELQQTIEEIQKLIQNECDIIGIVKKNMYNTTVK